MTKKTIINRPKWETKTENLKADEKGIFRMRAAMEKMHKNRFKNRRENINEHKIKQNGYCILGLHTL